MDEGLELLCRDCDAIVAFVVPECEDGSDADLMCVLCGAAITFGGFLLAEVSDSAAA